MATRFQRYRMVDGRTRLEAAYFNAIFGDLDLRIADLEGLRIDWQSAVAELAEFGLERLNSLVMPLATQAEDLLDGLIANAAGFKSELLAEIQPGLDKLAMPLDFLLVRDANGRVGSLIEHLPAGTRSIDYVYDGAGRVSTATTTFAGIVRTETYTYDGNGYISGMTATENPL